MITEEKHVFLYGNVIIVLLTICLVLVFIILFLFHDILIVLVGVCLSIVIIIIFGYKSISNVYDKDKKMLRLYAKGHIDEHELKKKISPYIYNAIMNFNINMDKNKKIELVIKQSQYLALHNQINPHFLYNILEGIRSEAIVAGADNIASMTESLAIFFRYTISSLDKLVTLDDELSIIETYFTIQKFRFGDKLKLSIEYDDINEDLPVLNFKLPKLTLQPIIENSIYHGIEKKMGEGLVQIKVKYTQTRLLICISDNGVGIDEEILKKISNNLLKNSSDDSDLIGNKSAEGIAISNVSKRIKLLFGEEYGVNIYSVKNIGTDVEIVLPIIK